MNLLQTLSKTIILSILLLSPLSLAQEHQLHSFDRKQLTDVYYSEGAAVADINKDGHPDIIYGPYWFEGPSFDKKHEIYPPKPQPTNFYADNFFTWAYDFNNDGWPDLLVVGLPGTPAFIFENPGKSDAHWTKRQVFDSVGNESPAFLDLLGNKQPVLVCAHKGAFGYASFNKEKPYDPWTWHTVSEKSIKEGNPHGLGVGDLNQDGRNDILIHQGWFEQPEKDADTITWKFHAVPFTNAYGGAEMYVYDVNGDGKMDVIASLAAHDFGLAWYEQDTANGQTIFRQHIIVGEKPEQNPHGIVFSELHSVALADIDGDGVKDIITGKTYWSHHKASPQWDAGAVVYWFSLHRNTNGSVDWIPHKADGDAGIGRQIRIDEINGDKRPDIVVGGMKGATVLTHRATKVDDAAWQAAQPKILYPQPPIQKRGPAAEIDPKTGHVEGAIEGESLTVIGTHTGQTSTQDMEQFKPDAWSGGKQLFWTGAKPGDRLDVELPATDPGNYELQAVFTMASDFAIIQLTLDDKPLGEPIDLYNAPVVITTGVLKPGQIQLTAGKHKLGIEIKGADPSSTPGAFRVGLDWVKLVKTKP
jgi:hypothetical protein